jgi:hypothetical protein
MDTRLRSAAASAVCAFALVLIGAGSLLATTVEGGSSRLFAGGPSSVRFRRPVEDRVIDLPEDGDMWHLVLVTDTSETSKTLQQSLAETPRLANLMGQVKVHAYPTSYWWVKQYFGGESLPIVYLATESGERVYKASGGNFPGNGEELADEIESSIWAFDCGPDCNPSPTRPNSRVPDLRGPGGSEGGSPIGGTELVLLTVTALAGGAAVLRNRNKPAG